MASSYCLFNNIPRLEYQKHILIYYQNSRENQLKTIPFLVAHTYIGSIRG